MQKKCSKCKQVKTVGDFSKHSCQCKVCKCEYSKQYALKNKEKVALYSKEYYTKNRIDII